MPHAIARLFAGQDLGLLGVSALVCLAASLCVFRLRSRMRYTRGSVRIAWIFFCGTQVGTGVWATHFIGLLACRAGMPVGYDPFGTIMSLLVAVSATFAALLVAWTGRDRMRLLAGGLLLSLALAGMQYAGLSAYKIQGRLEFDPATVWLSVALCTAFTTAALFFGGRGRNSKQQVVGGVLLCTAMLTLHFTGMAAIHRVYDPSSPLPAHLLDGGVLAFIVILLAVLMIFGGAGAAYVDDASSRTALRRTRRLADAAREGIVVINEQGNVLDCNAAFAGLLGLEVSALVGRPLLGDLLDLEGDVDLQLEQALGAHLHGRGDDPIIPVEVFARTLADEHDLIRNTVVAVRDLREQRQAEDKIRHLAEHDALTGLPNRLALHARLPNLLSHARADGRKLSVTLIDLDHFKAINELHGHAAGDALLVETARRLQAFCVEPSFVARQGGDELVVVHVAPLEKTLASLGERTSRLLAGLREPVIFEGRTIDPSVTAGVSRMSDDPSDADVLLGEADIALSRAKESRRGEACFFSANMDLAAREQRKLTRDLREGIAADQLVVHYQPQARADDESVFGFEALVRWRHPERGLMSPDKFIHVAEENGLIPALGEWVLRRACTDAAAWPNKLSVAVNLSPLQVNEPGLPALVHEILAQTGLSPSRLELEITESALFSDHQQAPANLRRLKALGVRIAMDDFGTGYSSLSTLHSFPFDKLKIDKSFVEGIGRLERSTVIVRAVLGIGSGLGIPVVAEGVETAEQVRFLREAGCDELQGYHIGRPAPQETHAALTGCAPPPARTAAA